jgi:hypothetical protein
MKMDYVPTAGKEKTTKRNQAARNTVMIAVPHFFEFTCMTETLLIHRRNSSLVSAKTKKHVETNHAEFDNKIRVILIIPKQFA